MTIATAPRLREWAGLAVLLAATFMTQVDGFLVTIAAPSLQRDLAASFREVQFVGAAYVLATAAGLITGSRLGDRYGRKRMFLLGVGVFTLASLACGLAPDPGFLIAARAMQGAAAALLVPQELALIRSIFVDETQRAKAISAYGVVVGLGVIAGLAGGGLIVHWDIAGLGWRAAFLVNVPIGVLITILGTPTISEARSSPAPRLDPIGAVLTGVALTALLIPVVFGASGWIWLSAAVGVLVVIALIRQQQRAADPLFPPRVLTARGMPASLAAIATFFGGNAGLFLVFTYYVQTGLGHDPLSAGMMFVPLGFGFAFGSAVSGPLLTRVGPRLPAIGCAFLAVALAAHLAVVQATPDAQTVLLGVVIGVVGLAEGLVVSPLLAGIFNQVSADDAGAASGAAATVTQIGLAAGYAAVGSCYRMVLGVTPGTPAPLPDHMTAYSASITVTITLALATCLLSYRRRFSTRAGS